MGLIAKVRVADLVGDQAPISSTSSEGILSRANLRDASRLLVLEGEVDQATHDTELKESENSDNGVLYCELGNSLPVESEDADGEKNMVDPSIACITATDES